MANNEMNAFPRWMAVALAIALLALVAGGVWFYHSQERMVRHTAEEQLALIGRLKADQIVIWRAERLADAVVMTESPFFAQGVARFLADPSDKNAQPFYSRFQSLQVNYTNILLVDPEGKVLLNLTSAPEQFQYYAAALAGALRKRKPLFTDLYIKSEDSVPHICVVAPIFDDTALDAHPLGAVVLVCDASRFLFPLIQFWPTPSKSAETLLIRRDGEHVLFLNNLRHLPDSALKLRIPLSRTDVPAVMAVLGRQGVFEGRDYRGVDVLSVILPITDSSWYMVAKQDAVEVFAQWRFRALLILALFMALVGGVTAIGLVARQRYKKAHYLALYLSEVRRRATMERHSVTLKAIGDAVIAADASGRVELLNPVAEALTGWTDAEARGLPLEELICLIDEKTRERVKVPEARMLRDSVIAGTADHTLLIAKDGTERPVANSAAPIRTNVGDVTGVVLVFRDQTAERSASAALRASEQKFRMLFENMTTGFALHEMIYDPNGRPTDYRFIEINPAFERLTGARAQDMIGRTVKEVMPNTEQYWIETYGKVAESGEPLSYENYSQEIGRHFEVWAFSPGQHRFAVVFSDITERKRAEQLVADKNKELEQIIYVASHDLRSPLVNVDGYGRELAYAVDDIRSALDAGNVSPGSLEATVRPLLPEMSDALYHIRNSARQMDALLKGLLKLSRSGRAALTIGPIDMNALIARVLSSSEFAIKTAGVELLVSDLPSCQGDEVQITQVFANLVGNALKFLDPARPGVIRVSGAIEHGQAVYCVADNGIGIASEHQEIIFELFHRLDPSKTEGEGLGLTIVRQILDRLEGKIRVESVQGQGSRFFVTLPRAKTTS